jgi:cellulose synthase/poly-beta-1,6-N-acetylglucosamine synthase-like glycosyltransferase
MVRVLLLVLEVVVAALVSYNLLTALAGWRQPRVAPVGSRRRRFRVVIPAHNEERVIANVIADLKAQDYDPAQFQVWVLADRCGDATQDVALALGVSVAERREGLDGKGALLAWYLEKNPLSRGETLVVVDADNRVPPNLLARFSDELEAGRDVLQAYLDVANPDSSIVTTASALSYWASNRMVQLARHNLGWSADLGGTGMAISALSLFDAGGFGSSLVEDQELGVRLLLAGHPVGWLHDVRIADEKPSRAGVAIKQRSRWVEGRRQVARRWFVRLVARRSPASWDLALRLIQPSRMGIALVSALLALLSALGAPLWPWWVWAIVAGVQVLAPLPFLIRDGVKGRYLVKYPAMVLLPFLKIPARLRRNDGWYHTPHSG